MPAPGQVIGPTTVPTTAPSLPVSSTRPALPVTEPSTAAKSFESDAGHFGISYPAGWESFGSATSSNAEHDGKQISDTTVLTVVPAGAKNDNQSISIDLPSLPPHIPGFIPLGLVASGYVSDLRKQHPDLKVEESSAFTVPHAQARRICTTWKSDGRGSFDLAVLVIHDDHILIFSADGDADRHDEIRKAFDVVVSSIQWLR
jgi:hypothetical protein